MAAELGRAGGKALVKKRGKGYMKEIAQRGAKARWASSDKKVDNKKDNKEKDARRK